MALVRDVDTVEEATDVLVLDEADVVDHGGALADEVDVGALDDELVLDIGGAVADDVALHLDAAHALLAEEVADLDRLLVVGAGDVDGEVSVHEAQLVAEADGHARDQVLDGRAHRVDLRDVLARAVPHVHFQPVLALRRLLRLDVDLRVAQVARQRAARPRHRHFARLDGDRHYSPR